MRAASGDATTRLEPKTEQRAHAARLADRVEEFVRASAFAWEPIGWDSPHSRHVLAGRGVVDMTIARQLVGLLSVFSPPLPIALPGQAAISTERLAHFAQSQHEVGERRHRVHALGLLLRTTSGQQHAALTAGHQLDSTLHIGERHSGAALTTGQVERRQRRPHRLEAGRACCDIGWVYPSRLECERQQGIAQSEIGARRGLQVNIRGASRLRVPGVDDDQPAPTSPLLVDPLDEGRHGFGTVGSPQ